MNQAAFYIMLYIDEDVSDDLAIALRQRGYDALSVAEAGLLKHEDEEQLEFAVSQGRAILTYNGDDYIKLAAEWFEYGREHAGIVISQQFSKRQFGALLKQVLRLLDSLTRDEMRNQVIHLQSFR